MNLRDKKLYYPKQWVYAFWTIFEIKTPDILYGLSCPLYEKYKDRYDVEIEHDSYYNETIKLQTHTFIISQKPLDDTEINNITNNIITMGTKDGIIVKAALDYFECEELKP